MNDKKQGFNKSLVLEDGQLLDELKVMFPEPEKKSQKQKSVLDEKCDSGYQFIDQAIST